MRHLFLYLFPLLLASALTAAPKNYVSIKEIQSEGKVKIVAHNRHAHAPHHVELSFPSLQNFRSTRGLPIRKVLAPGQKMELTTLVQRDTRRNASYRLSSKSGMGDPNARHNRKAVYLLPWAHGKKQQVVQGWFGKFTHRGKRALDFDLKTGSAIHAARAGVVTRVKENSNIGGPGKRFAPHSNVVEILHNDGTWATYAHLKKNGALVKEGQRVKAGQKIALSGATGQAKGPHLHFAVHKGGWREAQTVETRFLGMDGKPMTIREGEYLYAVHPGGKPFKAVFASQTKESDLEKHRAPAKPGKTVEIRDKKVDDRVYLYLVNRTRKHQEVEFSFGRTKNIRSSKKFPLKKVVPPLTEVYLLTVTVLPGGDAVYQSKIRYRPVRGPKGK